MIRNSFVSDSVCLSRETKNYTSTSVFPENSECLYVYYVYLDILLSKLVFGVISLS